MKVLVAGDYCPQDRVAELFKKGDYIEVFGDMKKLVSEVDFSIVNLECPVIKNKAVAISKQGPSLSCTEDGVDALRHIGFSCVTLANNHFRDFGEQGVKDTLDTLNTMGINHVGGGTNLLEASKVFYENIGDKTIAIINCCEQEFSIATETYGGSNPLNPIQQYRDIQEARSKSDYVLVVVHGGHEHFQYPSFRMVETYRFFIDAGADVVINHHQHCYSGYEIYNGKPIFYGLGNFCFDNPQKRKGLWTEGYFVVLDFGAKNTEFKLYPYDQCNSEPCVQLLPMNSFSEQINDINKIIRRPELLKEKLEEYYKSNSWASRWLFEPFRNGLYFRLHQMGILPSFISRKHKLFATDYILCESHREKLEWWLNQN